MTEFEKLTDEEIAWFIATHEWKFAKTMAYIPHAYTLRERAADEPMFERFVIHIRVHGYDGQFYSKTYRYFDFGPYQYWTMGSPLEQTKLINRALTKEYRDKFANPRFDNRGTGEHSG